MENTKQELAEDYVELAKSYICERNYEKAERFLMKAKQLSPAKKIDETLAKLASLSKEKPTRRKVRSSLFNNTQEEFDRLLRQTDEHLVEKNLKKAEELLARAKQLNHNERVDILTTRLNFMKRQASNEEYINFSKNANKDEAEKCISMAKQSIKEQDYKKAEKLLLKAKRLHPSRETDLLLARLYSMYNQHEASRENVFNIEEAERCVQLAEEQIAKKSYEKAKKFLLKAKRLCPSAKIDESLAVLEGLLAQQRDENSNQFSKEINKSEAERCIQMAQSCISQSNYDKAEKLLKKAKKLYPGLNVEDLLQKVSNLKQQKRKSESYFFRVDMNKEEAERCLEMAVDFMAQRNFDKARKLLMKAKKLYPMSSIDEALKNLESMSKPNSKKNNPGSSQKHYTKEQEEIVNRILSCKANDYYEIMQVSVEADVEEVKKVFKKLAVKVHPDKNYAPGAEEAFKRLNRANEVLSTKPKSSKSGTQERKKESPKPSKSSTKQEENDKQKESSFQENFDQSYQESSFNHSFNWGPRFNTSFEEETKPRDNYSSHYRQESNSFNFDQQEWFNNSSFNNSDFHQGEFYDNYSKESSSDPSPGFSKTQLVALTVLSTIIVIFVGKYFFFNQPSQTTNNYYFDFGLDSTLSSENFAHSQQNNLSSEASESYSLMKYFTEIEYQKHLSSLYSGVTYYSVSTYNFLAEVKWRDHTMGFVIFFYDNTKNMLICTKNSLWTVGQFCYPYIFDAYYKSTELCSSVYNFLIGYDWLNVWNKTREISVSLVPWESLGRMKNGCANIVSSSYRSLVGFNWSNFWSRSNSTTTEVPQDTLGWIKNSCINFGAGSYNFFAGYDWTKIWTKTADQPVELPPSTFEWIKNSCWNYSARFCNLFVGYDWGYFWSRARDLSVACIPWSSYEWLRNNYLNSNFALMCLKTSARAAVSSITYVSQSIYSLVKEK